MSERTYIGDGVYVHDDGFHIVLTGNANGQDNEVYLGSSELSELMSFIERSRGLKITVKKSEGRS